MGSGTFKPQDWDKFKTIHKVETKSAAETFSRAAKAEFDPAKIDCRHSCETKDKPQVTPIIIALDVTGSMGKIPEALIKGGLATLMEEVLKRASIPNPHVLFMAVGDVNYDKSPLQATQFEADIRIAAQLKDLYLEGGGGPNNSESYPMAWLFAAHKTELDCFKNRGEKGILFTIGDEHLPEEISGAHIARFLGEKEAKTIATADILHKVQTTYDVFHLGIKQSRSFTPEVQQEWNELFGQSLIVVEDYTKVPEMIVSTIDLLLAQRRKAKADFEKRLANQALKPVNHLEAEGAPGGPQIPSYSAGASASAQASASAVLAYQWKGMPEGSPPPYHLIHSDAMSEVCSSSSSVKAKPLGNGS